MYAVYFQVKGGGSFPVDMLRYDRAVPAGEQDSVDIETSLRPFTERDSDEPIELVRMTDDEHWTPTEGRWKSFGWRVVDGSVDRAAVR